ncbi:hypothetical protein RJT34_20114 [Clitoria ternatea]|uniref:Uncharacterized protein n=1 Tax=Clitoria ternatea TaxID=43366 RepID=A0AAN9IS91_CLITE
MLEMHVEAGMRAGFWSVLRGRPTLGGGGQSEMAGGRRPALLSHSAIKPYQGSCLRVAALLDLTGGEGGSGAGPSQRRGHIDLTFPPGSGDELSDLVAKLDQVEREISRLSESRVESVRGLEARQNKLVRLKMVLSEFFVVLGYG